MGKKSTALESQWFPKVFPTKNDFSFFPHIYGPHIGLYVYFQFILISKLKSSRKLETLELVLGHPEKNIKMTFCDTCRPTYFKLTNQDKIKCIATTNLWLESWSDVINFENFVDHPNFVVNKLIPLKLSSLETWN